MRGNFTYSKNTVLEVDEVFSVYPYRMQKGYRVGQVMDTLLRAVQRL